MVNTKLLEKYIQKNGYRKKFIAEKLGITAYAFSLKISGTNEFKGSEIKILMNLLNLDLEKAQAIFFA